MAILGNIIKQAIGLSKVMPTTPKNGARTQQKTLRKLLSHAEYTAFGEQ